MLRGSGGLGVGWGCMAGWGGFGLRPARREVVGGRAEPGHDTFEGGRDALEPGHDTPEGRRDALEPGGDTPGVAVTHRGVAVTHRRVAVTHWSPAVTHRVWRAGSYLADDVALFQGLDDRVGVQFVAGFDHDFEFGGLHRG